MNVRSKVSEINNYYFNISIYKNDFYFFYQVIKEIDNLLNNLEKYYSEEYFDSKLSSYIYTFTTENLNPLNDELYNQIQNLKKQCEKNSDKTRNKNYGDYCWNNNKYDHKWHYLSVTHTNNYKILFNSFENATDFIKSGSEKIINEFIEEFSPFLDSFIIEFKNLFEELYNYTETKLTNNEELNILCLRFNEIIKNMSDIADYQEKIDEKNFENFFKNVYNITKNIDNDFFENYYLKNFSSFLEYPDEILYKVVNFGNELKLSSEAVKKQINYLIQIKILRSRNDNHYFIFKTKEFLEKIIKLRVENKLIFERYKEYRINNNLNNILGKYNYINKSIEEILNNEIYDNKINITIQEYKNIIYKIEERINKDWILDNCTKYINETENNYHESDSKIILETYIICLKYKNKSSLNYSEYNFNTVKIRTAIYYIKYLYENLENLFNEFNFHILMNDSKIKYQDEIINYKNIIDLYNKTLENKTKINKEIEEMLVEYIDYYIYDINESMINELDFIENFDVMKNVLNFSDENFNFEIDEKLNSSSLKLLQLLDEYNETLNQQINMIKSYKKFNYNKTIFENVFNLHFNEIELNFNELIDKLQNIYNDYILNNILKTRMETLNEERAKIIRIEVENMEKNFDIKPFNLTFNIGEKTEIILKELFEDKMFTYIYDYIELYEFYRNIFKDDILKKIDIKKGEIINKFKEITNNFYEKLDEDNTEYINNDYIKNYINKFKNCLNYPLEELNNIIIKDKENYNNYIIHENKLKICSKIKNDEYDIGVLNEILIDLNITNSSIFEILEKIKIIETDLYNSDLTYISNSNNNQEKMKLITILNEYLNETCNEIFNNEIVFINQTEIYLDCENNFWYKNYLNISYFNNFDDEILQKLSKISSEYNNMISSYYIGGNFVENYIISNDYIKLNHSEIISRKQIKVNLENFQDISDYINYLYENKYNQLLKKELINIYNESFIEFIEKIITGDIEDNILIYIFGKINISTEYIKQKIINENNYYNFLFNKTKELGITSKKAMISLYDYIIDRLNKTLIYQLEDHISDNIIFFYRENKYIFKDLFIEYFVENKNEIFGIENIFNLKKILPELIFSKDFNKTLEAISQELLENLLIKKIYNNMNNKLDILINQFLILLKNEQNKIKDEIKKIKTVELYENMLLLAEMIDNYTVLVNEQNNRFKFVISNIPLEKFQNFSKNYLEPPLDEIKEYYDKIQNELLKQINEIVNNMKDVYEDIRIEYNITDQLNNMINMIENTYQNLVNYCQDLIDDINEYDDILLLYTYLGDNNKNLRQLNQYLRSDERNLENIRNKYNLTINETYNKILKGLAENKKREYHKNRTKSNLSYNDQKYNSINLELNSNNIYKNNNYKNKNKNLDSNYNQRKIRRLSTHSNQGSISIFSLDKEVKKFIKSIKNFNRTFLTGEYLKLKINWLKEENKIKKYLMNSRRSIEISALRLASIITEDKMNSLEEILYFKHDQITTHINNFINLVSQTLDNYMYLLGNSSETLDQTYNEVNYKILLDFHILKELITGQIKEIKNIKKEEINGNEKLNKFFKNPNVYRPIDINLQNSTNNKSDLTKSKTINKYQKILKYTKYITFNETEKKFEKIKNILEESKIYINNIRRMDETSPKGSKDQKDNPNENNDNKKDDNKNKEKDKNKDINKDDIEKLENEFNLMKGKLSSKIEIKLKVLKNSKLDKLLNKFNKPIPILSPLSLFLEPEINVGFYLCYEFQTKLYDDILDTEKLEKTIRNNKEEEGENETKLTIKIVGKAEVSMSVSVGIEISFKLFKMAIKAGIRGLIASGEIGVSIDIHIIKLNIKIDLFYKIKAFCFFVFLKIEFVIITPILNIKFEIFIFNLELFGIEYERHFNIKKYILKLIEFILEYQLESLP